MYWVLFSFLQPKILCLAIEAVEKLDLFFYKSPQSGALKYCPVSALINTESNGVLGYPMDIFDPPSFMNYKKALSHQSEKEKLTRQMLRSRRLYVIDEPDESDRDAILLSNVYNCTSTESPFLYHYCSSLTKCPLSKQSLLASAEASNRWPILHSFCYLREIMASMRNEVRIFVLGGSVTFGSAAHGCCCDKSLDIKCSFAWANDMECGTGDVSFNCRWSNAFVHWLKSISRAKVSWYNYALGGATSSYMAEALANKILDDQITAFRSSDIIFLDHSVNDVLSEPFTSSRLNKMQYGLESLVKKIYSLSTINSWPTVILLEVWPFSSRSYNLTREKLDYQNVYRSVAKEFKLPLWSYRDTVDYMVRKNASSVPYLTFEHNVLHAHQHPPWYVHRLIADILAANFLREMWKCHAGNGKTPETRPTNEMTSSFVPMGVWKEEDHCDPDVPVYMDITAQRAKNHGVHAPVKIAIDPEKSWLLMEDRPGKYGWVTTRTSNRTMVSSITFSFPANHNTTAREILLKFHYLRTYKNAGRVTSYACGNRATVFDALWSDFNTNHISIPVIASYLFRCFKEQIDIEFRHESIVPDVPQDQLSPIDKARGDEKFKLIAVRACAEIGV